MMKQQRFQLKTAFTLLLVLAGFATTWAQNRTVTGVVNDAKGDPLPTVTILEKGTQNGVVTDFDGKFTLKLTGKTPTLVVSFIGFTPQEIAVGNQTAFNIKLAEDAKTLGEVVVVGYGTQRKKDLTGSISTLSERNFQKGNITTPEQLIAGKIAGVAITPNDGAPGSGSRIRIRGGASLGDDGPLIVVDGVPLGNEGIGGVANGLSLINPNDIESVTVLKDASASAIYGSRASNGVIMVVTKKGKKGDALRINFSSVLSSAQITNYVPVLTGDEFRTLVNKSGNATQKGLLGKENTDWQKLIYRNGFGHDENLSFTGTLLDNALPYRLSLGYKNQDGNLLNSNFDRKSVGLNLNPRFFDDHLRVDISYKGSYVKSKFPDGGAIGGAVSFDPTQPVYSGKDNVFQGYNEWRDNSGSLNTLAGKNPLGLINSQQDVANVNRHIANAIFDYKFPFLPDLRANVNVAVDRANTNGTKFRDSTSAAAFRAGGVSDTYTQQRTAKTFESYLNYVKEFSGIRADVMAGYGYQDFYYEGVQNDFNLLGVRRGDTIPSYTRPTNQTTIVSFFGRANFTLFDRYLATFTVRQDGSSRLAPGHKWITYPAAALAWRMTNDGIGKSVFSDLKLRVGYGITGQQDGISEYSGLKLFSLGGNTAQYPFGNAYIQTLRPEGFNELLTWQKTTTTNFGIDFTTKNERISGAIDYYIRETSGLFNDVRIPAGANFTNELKSNIGTLENKGIELTLNTTPIKTGKLNWEANFILARNQNKITKLTIVDDAKSIGIVTGDVGGGVGNKIQLHQVGTSKNAFFVYQQVYDGEGKPLEGVYVDRNGDGKITGDDRYLFQKPDADYILGFTSNLTYDKLSFGFVLRGSIGNYMYSDVNAGGVFNSSSVTYLNNPAKNVLETGFTKTQTYSDYYVENASFLKMDNLTVGYNLSSLFGKKYTVQLTAIVQNVLTVTKYKGIDPEIAGGIDKNIYLRPRTYSLGINVNF